MTSETIDRAFAQTAHTVLASTRWYGVRTVPSGKWSYCSAASYTPRLTQRGYYVWELRTAGPDRRSTNVAQKDAQNYSDGYDGYSYCFGVGSPHGQRVSAQALRKCGVSENYVKILLDGGYIRD